jgi:hypothetical protein
MIEVKLAVATAPSESVAVMVTVLLPGSLLTGPVQIHVPAVLFWTMLPELDVRVTEALP